MKSYAILLDTTICTGCNSCTYKCIQENRLHDEASRGLFRTFVEIKDEGTRHYRCMLCREPVCVDECPEGALTKTDYGPVLYDESLCVGCETCADACPFGVPQLDPASGKIIRCNMCAHRVKDGRQPACVEVCPNLALSFGEYEEIAAIARARAEKEKLHIYGLTENGGGQFITIMKGDPASVGYPAVGGKSAKREQPALNWASTGIAGLAIGGLKAFSDRRARIESEKKKPKPVLKDE